MADKSQEQRIVESARFREFWLLIVAILWIVLAISLVHANHDIAKGRKFATRATCAAISAIASEGHDVILNSSSGSAARKTADSYVRGITNFLVDEVGGKGYHLVRKDGTLNCEEFERLSLINASSR